MSELARPEPTSSPFEALLEDYGRTVQDHGPAFTIPSLDSVTHWQTTRFYGVEGRLPDGGAGRFIVRQVEQLPDLYIATHPDSRTAREFPEYRQQGILADVAVRSIGIGHLVVARSSILQVTNTRGTNCNMNSRKSIGIGRATIPTKLLAFDPSGMEITRQLDETEIDYTEPSALQLVRRGLRQRRQIS